MHVGQGITACVRADWTVRSPRRIQLRFREAGVSQLHISDETEALLAPALLPRTWLTQRLLMALQEVSAAAAGNVHFCNLNSPSICTSTADRLIVCSSNLSSL